jgi:pimeloyl-ACP methyl ester carboxylesterase
VPEININGETVFYRRNGSGGKMLLFVHGAGGNSLHWLATEQPEGWQALAVDLPGHGRTGGEPSDSIQGYADWLAAFIETLGEKPVLAGHSMGGAIAQTLALTKPKLLSGLVLAGTGARLGVSPAILELCRSGDAAAVAQLISDSAYGPLTAQEKVREWNREFGLAGCYTYLADFTACNSFDIRERLGEITLPVLVICGSEDRLTPPKYSRYLAEHLADAVFEEIPQAGHMLMLEQPLLFNRALATFCSRIIF